MAPSIRREPATPVSIVIPTLDEEENLPRCLSNLRPQIRAGDEVIIVDGGSDDNTVEVAESFDCTVAEAEGAGVGVSRAIGTELATNEIIVSTDADTLPPSDWLPRIRQHFSSDPELTVLWGTIVDSNGVPIRNLTGKFSTLLRGASGNNTAFRKSAYEELKTGYPDTDFLEDFAIINRLSRVGKAKRDSSLIMVMNMDRRRYQTAPLVATGITAVIAGEFIPGDIGTITRYAGLSIAGTELLYEGYTNSPFHHDSAGLMLVGLAPSIAGPRAKALQGIGMGMFLHHGVTEGISMAPTELERNTEEAV